MAEISLTTAFSTVPGPEQEAIKRVLTETIERIDRLYARQNKSDIIGLASGFTDLDRMTAGFQEGELIVIAGRPWRRRNRPKASAWHAMLSVSVPSRSNTTP